MTAMTTFHAVEVVERDGARFARWPLVETHTSAIVRRQCQEAGQPVPDPIPVPPPKFVASAIDCPECGGHGEGYGMQRGWGRAKQVHCDVCGGSGKVSGDWYRVADTYTVQPGDTILRLEPVCGHVLGIAGRYDHPWEFCPSGTERLRFPAPGSPLVATDTPGVWTVTP